MKYFLFFLQKIISCVACILISVLVFILAFNILFTKENIIKNFNDDYIRQQKTKLNNDLQSVCYANGVSFDVFKDFITDDIIKKNDEEYINSIFQFINGKVSSIIPFTNTANEYELGVKKRLKDYAEGLGKDEYTVNQNSIDSFANLAKTNFSHSAVPIIGFETFATYLKKYNSILKAIPLYLALGIVVSFLILLLFNKGKKHLSFVNILYSISAAGLILSIINGLALWIVVTKNTALNYSYLKIIAGSYTRYTLIVGILLLILSQIFLVLLFNKKKK